MVFSGDERGVDERPASATADSVPASQQQSQDLVKDVKQSVAELRVLVKDAVSHREKCCTVLSSALAVSLALEQVRIVLLNLCWPFSQNYGQHLQKPLQTMHLSSSPVETPSCLLQAQPGSLRMHSTTSRMPGLLTTQLCFRGNGTKD